MTHSLGWDFEQPGLVEGIPWQGVDILEHLFQHDPFQHDSMKGVNWMLFQKY